MDLHGRQLCEIYTDLLIQYAKGDERICIVESDLMRAIQTLKFREVYPKRSVDLGVQEANMIGVAAGMSTLGLIPFTHSFTPFASRRCCDQITLSVSYAKLNVKMIGSDPGVTAMLNGGTHMSFEDIAILRNIPDMVIYEPVDGVQLANMFPKILEYHGAVYIRLLRREFPSIFEDGQEFELGKATTIKEGTDVSIICSGIMVHEALEAEKILANEGISASVVNMHTIKPLDTQAVINEAKKTGAMVTAENHSILNGLGGAVCECLADEYPIPVKRVGVKDHFGEVGMQDFLMEKYGLLAKDIVEAAKASISMKRG
ncbi:MAG: transketolase family protein [Clostridia bacterium]|nr:transketolase family protein [Clostridia bacterium]